MTAHVFTFERGSSKVGPCKGCGQTIREAEGACEGERFKLERGIQLQLNFAPMQLRKLPLLIHPKFLKDDYDLDF